MLVAPDRFGIEAFIRVDCPFGVRDGNDLVSRLMRETCEVIACIAKALHCDSQVLGRFAFALGPDIQNLKRTAPRSSYAALGPAEA